MAYKIPPRVRMTISVGGTGNITLNAAVNASFQTLSNGGVSNNDTFPYYIEEGLSAECGVGTYISASNSFTRSVIFSTNANSPVNFTTAAIFAVSPLPADLAASGISGLIKGSGAGALSAAVDGTDYISPDTTAAFSAGFTLSPYDAGTKSSGTWTPDPTLGNYQYITNGGAFTIGAPSVDCAMDILVINGASSGAIGFSGFKTPPASSVPYATTNNTWWYLSIRRANAIACHVWNGPFT